MYSLKLSMDNDAIFGGGFEPPKFIIDTELRLFKYRTELQDQNRTEGVRRRR